MRRDNQERRSCASPSLQPSHGHPVQVVVDPHTHDRNAHAFLFTVDNPSQLPSDMQQILPAPLHPSAASTAQSDTLTVARESRVGTVASIIESRYKEPPTAEPEPARVPPPDTGAAQSDLQRLYRNACFMPRDRYPKFETTDILEIPPEEEESSSECDAQKAQRVLATLSRHEERPENNYLAAQKVIFSHAFPAPVDVHRGYGPVLETFDGRSLPGQNDNCGSWFSEYMLLRTQTVRTLDGSTRRFVAEYNKFALRHPRPISHREIHSHILAFLLEFESSFDSIHMINGARMLIFDFLLRRSLSLLSAQQLLQLLSAYQDRLEGKCSPEELLQAKLTAEPSLDTEVASTYSTVPPDDPYQAGSTRQRASP